VEREGQAAVVMTGLELERSIPPDGEVSVFDVLDAPVSDWSDQKPRCEGAGQMTVTSVTFRNGGNWRADGTRWPRAKR
jgi:hypothetical protein